jgi:hypothetical protein
MNKIGIFALTSIALFALILAPVFAADGVDLTIRLYDQRIYFPGDPIQVRLTISNDSNRTFRFKLADQRLHNLDFDVRSMDNSSAEPSPYFTTRINGSERVSYRDVDLLPGEELSFIENISNYRSVGDGIFMVHARFYPELRGIMGQEMLISNTLTISVREGFRREDGSEIRMEEAMAEQMQLAALPPDEVVAYTIEARMHSRQLMFPSVPGRGEPVHRSAAAGRRVCPAFQPLSARTSRRLPGRPLEYRDPRRDQPDSHQLPQSSRRTTLRAAERLPWNNAMTRAKYVEIKRFTYELERRDGIWYIVSISGNQSRDGIMKIIVVSPESSDLSKLQAVVNSAGHGSALLFHYVHPLKAIDNLEEIAPDVIVWSIIDFPPALEDVDTLRRGDSRAERTEDDFIRQPQYRSKKSIKPMRSRFRRVIQQGLSSPEAEDIIREVLGPPPEPAETVESSIPGSTPSSSADSVPSIEQSLSMFRLESGDNSGNHPGPWTHPLSLKLLRGTVHAVDPDSIEFSPERPEDLSTLPAGTLLRGSRLKIGEYRLQLDLKLQKLGNHYDLIIQEPEREYLPILNQLIHGKTV